MTKEKAINFLYKDWLDYKKYYKEKQDFNMKETFIEYLEREIPEYIQLDEKNKKFRFVRVPKFEEVPYPIVMEPNLVIEYYSR